MRLSGIVYFCIHTVHTCFLNRRISIVNYWNAIPKSLINQVAFSVHLIFDSRGIHVSENRKDWDGIWGYWNELFPSYMENKSIFNPGTRTRSTYIYAYIWSRVRWPVRLPLGAVGHTGYFCRPIRHACAYGLCCYYYKFVIKDMAVLYFFPNKPQEYFGSYWFLANSIHIVTIQLFHLVRYICTSLVCYDWWMFNLNVK